MSCRLWNCCRNATLLNRIAANPPKSEDADLSGYDDDSVDWGLIQLLTANILENGLAAVVSALGHEALPAATMQRQNFASGTGRRFFDSKPRPDLGNKRVHSRLETDDRASRKSLCALNWLYLTAIRSWSELRFVVTATQRVDSFRLFRAGHKLGLESAAIILDNFADHLDLKKSTLRMPVHESDD
jgi:hypothetical protein